MRTIREILRLHFAAHLSCRSIARSCNKSTTTVSEILKKAVANNLSWPTELSDDELESRLYTNVPETDLKIPEPDWDKVVLELKRKGVTRQLLWQEYRRQDPTGYSYSQFCFLLSQHMKKLSPSMRQSYKGGEKLFVDWAGQKISYVENGQEHKASLFVGALGASNLIFAQVYRDETQQNWSLAHMECFEYLGGVPLLTIPDNTRTAVSRSDYYEPDINPSYHELALHYNTTIMPARARRPQDKAKAETSVQISEREILAPLRNVTFHSFSDLRTAVAKLLEQVNDRPFSKLEGCRRRLFDEVDKPHLLPLPSRRYSLGTWSRGTVFKDYHVQAAGHYYSVPWQHIGESVDIRVSDTCVEIYHRGTRIACHQRSHQAGRNTTLGSHRPQGHNAILNRSSDEYIKRAEKIGPNCVQTIRHTLTYYPHPEMSYRSCEGILRLAGEHGGQRLEAACGIAVQANSGGYKFIRNVLQNKRDLIVQPQTALQAPAHINIRGREYYAAAVNGGDPC